ncbi:GHKL domain-containing protein [Cohnella endophytica]|uniref:histidine kinase n=1 Tax=Cohnella endophytica TaxID=2419778 RepID=A0A494XYF9_9BACL|nr:HAMP domain-containing sensor histidine kinase [Cohnella endophytica]RKP55594.1 GHKL domain-containing protein [Cohnella endophytica]
MLYYFFALLLAAFVILFNDIRRETNRWAAFFLCCAAIGGVTDSLHRAGFDIGSHATQFINLVLTPYGVLVFSLVYSGIAQSKMRIYKWALLIPVGIMLAATCSSPEYAMNYKLLLVWTAPYYLVSCYVIIVSFLKERDSPNKKKRLVTALIVVPTLLAVLVFIYGARAIWPDFDFFYYISVFIGYSLAAGLLGTFLYSVLGVKLRFDRDPLEGAMKAAGSGSALLNHTIKNEIGKIAISSENLKSSIPANDDVSKQHLDIISSASEHMLAMVSRIHDKTKEIVLREQPCRLDQLCDECRGQRQPLPLNDQNIKITANYSVRPTVLCDPVHMKEVVNNLLLNAIEAMPAAGGTVEIRLNANKKGIVLTVEDSGAGIPAHRLVHVFEPFFSTKKQSRNFGLGLSYVYNVMQKSGGFVRIRSRENIGTAIELYFPRHKIIRSNRGESE